MAKLTITKASRIVYPLRMLIYGDSGYGKTHLAMQAALVEDMSPALLVACDMGTSTARRIDIDVVVLTSPSDLTMILRALSKKQLPYKTVIIDGFSMFYDMLVYSRSTGDAPGIREWMTASVDTKKLMHQFVKLGVNIIVTTLAQRLQEESTGQFYTCPLLPGKMAWRFAEAFDIVAFLSTKTDRKGITRLMQVQPMRRIIAKDRDDTVGKPVVDITWTLDSEDPPPMSRIWSRWTSYLEGQPPVTQFGDVELSEDEVEQFEAGDLSLEGGEVPEDVFA